MNENGATHTDEAIEAIADLERDAQDAISRNQRWIARVTNRIGQPLTFFIVVVFVVLWIGANLTLLQTSGKTFDPPPFSWLQGIVTLSGLLVAILILTTANRVAQIGTQRACSTNFAATRPNCRTWKTPKCSNSPNRPTRMK